MKTETIQVQGIVHEVKKENVVKPPTVLKQVYDLLKDPRNKDLVYIKTPFIFSFNGLPDNPVTLYISPCEPMLEIGQLNKFMGTILDLLKKSNLEPTRSTAANKHDKKGGIKFPEISFGEEIIGKKITSIYIAVSDSFYPDKTNPVSENITRRETTIKICPSPQIAELAFAAATFNLESIDKGFKATNALRDGITKKQLELVRKTTVRYPVRLSS